MEILTILCCGGGIFLLTILTFLFVKIRGANRNYKEFELTHDNYFGFFGVHDE